MDKMYEYESEGKSPSLLTSLEIAVHLIFCPYCTDEIARYEAAIEQMRTGFFPPSPGLAGPIMERIYAESFVLSSEFSDIVPELPDVPADNPDELIGVSFRGWVITGFIVLVSLATAFFSIDFERMVASQGSSFLLPVGLTIGVVISVYGALFIGSHLKELSSRFRLH
jgi:hypothetical protein